MSKCQCNTCVRKIKDITLNKLINLNLFNVGLSILCLFFFALSQTRNFGSDKFCPTSIALFMIFSPIFSSTRTCTSYSTNQSNSQSTSQSNWIYCLLECVIELLFGIWGFSGLSSSCLYFSQQIPYLINICFISGIHFTMSIRYLYYLKQQYQNGAGNDRQYFNRLHENRENLLGDEEMQTINVTQSVARDESDSSSTHSGETEFMDAKTSVSDE